jgi:hypothetical protein
MKTKQTSPIPTTIDEQESLRSPGRYMIEINVVVLIEY